jgi:TrmH family RNA methyltransferase
MYYSMPLTQRLRKSVKSLSHKTFRDEKSLFLIEGEKLCGDLLNSNFVVDLIVIRDLPSADIIEILDKFAEKAAPIYTAPKYVFDQITDTKTPQSIIAVAQKKENKLDTTQPFIALDGISDPGNVGTILRTADWFGINQIIVTSDSADIFSPKAVRSSMGSIFHLDFYETDNLPELLKEKYPKFKLYASDVHSDKSLNEIQPPKKFGIIFGNESHGVSEEVLNCVESTFVIEGYGKAESLNVAVSVGISLYHFTLKNKK